MNARTLAFAAAAAGLAGATNAQFTITPGGANGGNGYFAQGAQPTSVIGTGIGTSNFGATAATVADQLFQDWWFFRGTNDTREYTFATGSAVGGPTGVGVLLGNNAGTSDTGGYDYVVTNATGGYAFNANLRWRILSSPSGPFVVYSATITNASAVSPLSLALFHYNDFDANATAGTDTYTQAGNVFTITDGAVTLFHSGDNADAFQASAFASLRGNLSNTAINNLDNTVAGSPGDYTSGFQWNLNLAAGGSATVGGVIGFAIPTPGAAALMGMGMLAAARRRRS